MPRMMYETNCVSLTLKTNSKCEIFPHTYTLTLKTSFPTNVTDVG